MLHILSFIFLLVFPFAAFGHDEHVTDAVTKGFEAGLKHPILGLDHFLAMVSVGIISAQIGGRAVWSIPLMFVLSMVVGGITGMMGYDLGTVEVGIAMSVIFLGLVIAANAKILIPIILGFVSLFGIFHGYAHGLEMPDLAVSWHYIAGFMVGTAGLHILGVFIGFAAKKIEKGNILLRYSGAFIAGIGFHILLSL